MLKNLLVTTDSAPSAAVIESIMRRLFHIPSDLMTHPEYQVNKFYTLSGIDAAAYLVQRKQENPALEIFGDVPINVLDHFKEAAISERKQLTTGKIFIVYRHWYPMENGPLKQQMQKHAGRLSRLLERVENELETDGRMLKKLHTKR